MESWNPSIDGLKNTLKFYKLILIINKGGQKVDFKCSHSKEIISTLDDR